MLEKVLRGIVITCVFALPFIVLIVAESMFFPYITGKNFTFRILVEIMTGAWLALAVMSEKYRPRRSWILYAVGLFVFIMALADALGAYPFKSFWSNYERMDGWVTLIHLFMYVTVASSVLSTEKLWRLLWQVSLGVSAFLSIYGLLQITGFTALGQGGQANLATARIDATFGNPIYLAVYMLFHIAMAAVLWYQTYVQRPAGRRMWPSIIYGTVIAIDTLTLFLTATRGTMLGLFGGATLAILIVAFLQGSRRIKMIALATVIGFVVFGGVLRLAKDTQIVRDIGFLQRLASLSLSDSTVKARLLNAGMAWQGVKERPLLGWGQENYALVFDKYYDPRMYAAEPWFDRTHNIIFDWLVTGGFLGLFSYLSIYVAALYVIWMRGALAIPERAIFTGLLAGYFFHNLTVFDNVSSYILFATVLAYIVWREREAGKNEPLFTGTLLPQSNAPFVAAVAGILTIASVWWTNVPAYNANHALLQAIAPHQEGISKNLEYFKQALSYRSFGDQEIREQLAQITVQLAGAQGVRDDTKREFLQLADSEMRMQQEASPLDARFPLFRGVMLNAFGNLDAGETALKEALADSPKKQSIFYELAKTAQAKGDQAGLTNYLKTAFEVEPSNTEARLYYASEIIRQGNDTLADQVLAPVIEDGSAASPQIAQAYLSRGRYDKIITIWEALVKAQPGNTQGYFTLAAAYYAMGNKPKAIETLQRVKAADPSAVQQADRLIQEVQSGSAKIQ